MGSDHRRTGWSFLIAVLGNGGVLWLLSQTPDVAPPSAVPAMVVSLYPPFKIAPTPMVKARTQRRATGPRSSPAPQPLPAPLPVMAKPNGPPAKPEAAMLPFKGLVGCSDALKSIRSDADQTRCLEKWGRMARDLPTPERLAPIDPRKRAEYDEIARQQALFKERTLPNPFVPCKGPGSNFGLGCNAP
ncbi:MAG: hypothetical protein ORN25_11195 [Caulobacteraceae bacterium]|nr:hypothetical protein [Caulobacteraceae bacterium]